MLMAEGSYDLWPGDSSNISEQGWSVDEFAEDMSMDVDSIMNILDEPNENSVGFRVGFGAQFRRKKYYLTHSNYSILFLLYFGGHILVSMYGKLYV